MRGARPAVMVSYDSNGNYGHPDHINAHRIAVAAWEAAADRDRYPEAGRRTRSAKLYETAFNREAWLGLMSDMKERGIKLPWDFDEASRPGRGRRAQPVERGRGPAGRGAARSGRGGRRLRHRAADIATAVDVSAVADQKRACMALPPHPGQDLGWLLDLPDDLPPTRLSTEYFVLRRWRGQATPSSGATRRPTLRPELWMRT